jgi:hypothetical protein
MRRKRHLLFALVALAGCGSGAPPAKTAEEVKADSALAISTARRKAAAAAKADKMQRLDVDTIAAAGERPLLRESYAYQGAERDPFRSVLNVVQRGPELPDLRLTAIFYDERDPGNSIGVFRDAGNNRRYDVHPGQRIGRIYVASVTQKEVTLRLDDFGTVREQTYSLRKPEDEKP